MDWDGDVRERVRRSSLRIVHNKDVEVQSETGESSAIIIIIIII